MRIAFVGNFEVPFSTESHHKWTWEQMGHEVITFQQNRLHDDEDIIQALEKQNIQLFQATSTHGWPCFTMRTVEKLRELKIPSFSYHLDKYFGIGSREGSYLDHPSFHLDWFFSTDGNPAHANDWKKAGINHYYMPPGVVEYGTSYGRTSDSVIPIVFAGSVGYHAEYKFRPEMVHALHANYGENFRVVTGVREQALNDLFASSTCVVGDHIFAGEPYYWSDRLPESAGRGAFIVYPFVRGLEDYVEHGLVTYEPQNVQDLINKLDYYLDKGHEAERIERRNSVHNFVKSHCTYTHILNRILKVMGVE